ncbi:MAG: periplasmic heavy metal sensor [bacterium]
MNKKWFLTIAVLLTVVNLSALGTFTCKRWCHRRAKGGDGYFYYLKKELRLTDKQVSKMRNFRERFKPRMENLSQGIREKKAELVREVMAESLDTVRIESILREMDLSRSAIQREVVNNLLSQKEILKPEQRKKFLRINQNKRRRNYE